MNYKRIGRTLICLLLVCVLLVNISPIRAEAVAMPVVPGGTWGYVDPLVGIAAALNALGVRQGGSVGDFFDVVNAIADFCLDWFVDGLLPVLVLNSGPYTHTYIPEAFLQDILDLLYGKGTITSFTPEFGISQTITDWNGEVTYNFSPSGRVDIVHVGKYIMRIVWAPHYFQYSYNGGKWNQGSQYCGLYSNAGWVEYSYNKNKVIDYTLGHYPDVTGTGEYLYEWVINNLLGPSLDALPSTDFDLTLGVVAPDLLDGYPSYVGNSIRDDEENWYVPVTIPGVSPDVLIDQEQEQAQAGSTPQEVIDQLIGSESIPGTGDGTVTVPDNVTLKDILAGVLALPQLIAKAVSGFFSDVVTEIKVIPQTIVAGMTNVLTWAFVPTVGFADAEIQLLANEYPLFDSFLDTIQYFREAFSGGAGEPPVIYLHLEDAEGSYNWGGTVAVLDMHWYERYKPTVDVLLSGLMWVFFLWRLLVHAPNIISGLAGDLEAFNPGIFGGLYLNDPKDKSGKAIRDTKMLFERVSSGRFERRSRK